MGRLKPSTVFFLIIFFLPLISATCYFPDGSIADNQTPCSDATKESACCGQGYACLNNNLCKATGYEISAGVNYTRGACTDKSWRSASCSNACLDEYSDRVDDYAGLVRCKQYTRDFYYCLRLKKQGDCKTGYYLVSYPEAESAYTTIGVAPSTTTSQTSMSATSATGASALSSFTTSLSSSSVGNATGSAPTTSSTKSANTPADQNRDFAKMGIIIGGSIGGTCMVVIVSVSMCWFLRRGPYKVADESSSSGDEDNGNAPICEAPGCMVQKARPAELVSPVEPLCPVYEAP